MGLPQIAVAEAVGLHKQRDDALMSPRERGVLVTLLRDIKARTVIEIGCRDGRCAEIMLHNVPTISRYIGIECIDCCAEWPVDPVKHPDLPMEPAAYVKDHPRFELIVRRRGSFDLTPRDLPACDVMLIDGDHSRAAVENDTALARHVVRKGGLVVFHDSYEVGKEPDAPWAPNVAVAAVLEQMAATDASIKQISGTWLAVMYV